MSVSSGKKIMPFGEQLRILREARGMSVRTLADIAGIDFTYITKVESGRMNPPRILIIQALAQALGVEEQELLFYSGRVPLALRQQLLEGNVPLARLLEVLSQEPLPKWVYEEMILLAGEEGKGKGKGKGKK